MNKRVKSSPITVTVTSWKV